jgi:hypothetical protein
MTGQTQANRTETTAQTAPAHEAPELTQIMGAVALEVAELARAADSLQDLVGSLLCDPLAMPDASALVRGQALDAVVQRLQALETFLIALTPSLDPDWRVDPSSAADLLLLASLAQRLSGVAAVAADDAHEIDHDCDFF